MLLPTARMSPQPKECAWSTSRLIITAEPASARLMPHQKRLFKAACNIQAAPRLTQSVEVLPSSVELAALVYNSEVFQRARSQEKKMPASAATPSTLCQETTDLACWAVASFRL